MTLAWGDPIQSHYLALGSDDDTLIEQMLRETPAWVFHNAKFDLQKLMLVELIFSEDFDERDIHDTQTLAHLVDEHQRLGLKALAYELLGQETDEEQALAAWFKAKKIKKADRNYADLPPELLIPYAVKDAEFTLALFRRLYPQVARHEDLLGLYDMEMQLCQTLLRMESRGMKVRVDYLESKSREYAAKGARQEIAIRGLVGNPEFNPNSPQQVLAALAERGHELESTDAATLEGLDDELARLIVELRETRKIHGTYLLGLLAEQRDGLVHPWFGSNNTRTGRMSSHSRSK